MHVSLVLTITTGPLAKLLLDPSLGFKCLNEDNTGDCLDYKVRFCCPPIPIPEDGEAPEDWEEPECKSTEGTWTRWYNRNKPTGKGDLELVSEFINTDKIQICSGNTPIAIDARVATTKNYYWTTGQVVTINPELGLQCLNEDNTGNCWDYSVRFCCPKQFSGSKKPQDYGLPGDYTFLDETWGVSFYKVYTDNEMNYANAKAQCESDGASLAVPRSQAENDFIVSLIPNKHIWIGINDIDDEGTFVAVDGLDIPYTNWNQLTSKEPNNYQHNNGMDEDGVHIEGPLNGLWNDRMVTDKLRFICVYKI